MTEQTLILKNDISELQRMMEFISELCAREAIPPDLEHDVTLALDEMITNVVLHAELGDGEHSLTLRVSLDEDELVAQIEDDGRKFDPTQQPTPDLDLPLGERKIGGLGIYLVRRIMDSMEYARVNERNRVTLRKKRARAA